MTPKFRAKMIEARNKYARTQPGLITEDGRRFEWLLWPHDYQRYKIGSKAWLARRLNKRADDWCFEVFEVILQPCSFYPGHPKMWYGHNRYLVEPIT